ncbi:transcription regulator [Enterococcus canis]|uniref:Transcription regulator n=2 Tax=Enterococcus canis TaxID=214095 RepID=A0A1L8RIA7_9ENTE|nr:TetR/AcrR family transcriptional regulator [Enterococcus canis]OJG19486.1 transcription regulator [Enterococcus canis]
MKNLSKELILETAAQLVQEKKKINLSLSEVGETLGVSHAALYKYFPNKKALWSELSLRWLNQQLTELFPFRPKSEQSVKEIAHDWLWLLASKKYAASKADPQMFALYTTYVGGDVQLYQEHSYALGESFMAATGKDEDFTEGILLAFMYFSAPAYAQRWDERFQEEFEMVWRVVERSFEG